MRERRRRRPPVGRGLAERELEVEAVVVGDAFRQCRGHRRDVGGVEGHRLEVGEAPPRLAERRGLRQRLAVGGDRLRRPPDGLQRMAVAHPSLRLARMVGEEGGVGVERRLELAEPGERGGAQVAVARVARIEREQPVDLGQRVGRARAAMEDRREIEPRLAERRGELQRAPQQRLGVGVPPEPPGQLGEHPHRRHIGRPPLEPRPQQPLGDRDPPLGERRRRFEQFGIAHGGGHRGQCAASPPATSPPAIRRSPSACQSSAERCARVAMTRDPAGVAAADQPPS